MLFRGPLLASLALVASAGAASAFNPPAENASGLVLHSTLSEVTDRDNGFAETITDVEPGQTLTITGDCVMRANAPDALQVVLTLADALGAVPPGYRAVVATDQQFGSSGLQVRVPNMPEAANHVFQVRIFQLGQPAPTVCDAGSIRIGGTAAGKVG